MQVSSLGPSPPPPRGGRGRRGEEDSDGRRSKAEMKLANLREGQLPLLGVGAAMKQLKMQIWNVLRGTSSPFYGDTMLKNQMA